MLAAYFTKEALTGVFSKLLDWRVLLALGWAYSLYWSHGQGYTKHANEVAARMVEVNKKLADATAVANAQVAAADKVRSETATEIAAAVDAAVRAKEEEYARLTSELRAVPAEAKTGASPTAPIAPAKPRVVYIKTAAAAPTTCESIPEQIWKSLNGIK